jgi:hypothetical protein
LRPFDSHKLQFRFKQCVFLGYCNIHKGFKCLDVGELRVYISRDVVFDENVYPFAHLHPNAGARLHSEILLLPHILPNPSFRDDNTFNQSNNDSFCHTRQLFESAGHDEALGENPMPIAPNLAGNNLHLLQVPEFPLSTGGSANSQADTPTPSTSDPMSSTSGYVQVGAGSDAASPASTPTAPATPPGSRVSTPGGQSGSASTLAGAPGSSASAPSPTLPIRSSVPELSAPSGSAAAPSESAPVPSESTDASLINLAQNLGWLESEFLKEEIDRIIADLPNNKSPGPDGFNGEFLKKRWPTLAQHIYDMCKDFFEDMVCLRNINSS